MTAAWWAALPLPTVGGIVAARRGGRGFAALLATVTAASVAFPYLFLVEYAAPRFLLPAYALLAVPVAECVVRVLNRLGVSPPCVLSGDQAVPVAYYAGCASRQTSGHDASVTPADIRTDARTTPTAVLVSGRNEPPDYARDWRPVPLPYAPGTEPYWSYLPPPRVTHGIQPEPSGGNSPSAASCSRRASRTRGDETSTAAASSSLRSR